jgi:hypothetical protein
MRCEFAKDYHGSVWFQYSSDIYVRPNIGAKKDLEVEIERIKKMNQAHRDKLINDMDDHK